MARDVGGYFDKLKQRGRGGRRLDVDSDRPAPDFEFEGDAPEQPAPAPPPRRSGGGLGDMLKDILGKGRSTATKTSERAREQIGRRRSPTPTRTKAGGAASRTRDLPPEGVVRVEYSPQIDGDPDPGEVVWTWVPFEEDPEQGKDRPVVVIGRRGRSLVGVPLTTKQNDREAQIAIGTGEWDPKRRTSYARIWRMLDIDESKTRREGAVLERRRFDAVIAAVDEYYDVRRAQPAGQDDFDYDY